MSSSPLYKEFLDRMELYQRTIGMTQAEFGKCTGVTQSQVSKQRRGRNIVPYEVLEILDRQGCDLNFMLIGVKLVKTELDRLYERCGERYRKALLELMLWGVEQGLEEQIIRDRNLAGRNREIYARLNFIKLRIQDEEAEHSVLYGLRKAHRLSQRKMAETMKMDIKKYVLMEHGGIKPDAEILIELYELWEQHLMLYWKNIMAICRS